MVGKSDPDYCEECGKRKIARGKRGDLQAANDLGLCFTCYRKKTRRSKGVSEGAVVEAEDGLLQAVTDPLLRVAVAEYAAAALAGIAAEVVDGLRRKGGGRK